MEIGKGRGRERGVGERVVWENSMREVEREGGREVGMVGREVCENG